MAVTREAAISIAGDLYPVPTTYSLGDTLLISELTGMEMQEYAEAIEAMSDGGINARAFAGLLAVAVRAKHPTWKRDKIIRFVENIDFENIETVGGQEDAETVPPPVAEEAGED